jgi:2,3-bisphosphoglycerate-independent phosphoglycerate mutase
MASPVMLVILDGFGISAAQGGNAITKAHMPFWQELCCRYPHITLKAAGTAVGLLDGMMGNSEVGHLTLGAGRIIQSVLSRFHQAIADKTFFSNQNLNESFAKLTTNNNALHFMGLASDAGVHSHLDHLAALLQSAKQCNINRVYIHAFLDGRDCPPQSAAGYLEKIETLCQQFGIGSLASIHGRFFAMDRDNNWERTAQTYAVLTGNTRTQFSWRTALEAAYANNITDEFLIPTMLDPSGAIRPGDGVFFFNIRPDRARQLSESFLSPALQQFPNPLNAATNLAFFMTPVSFNASFNPAHNPVLFKQQMIAHTLLDEIDAQQPLKKKSVCLVAETEKYAHVTYFFRGMREIRLPHEQYFLIPSLKEKNYIQHPEMSASSITSTLIKHIRTSPAQLYVVNYANADMVGHSGNFAATVRACEVLDQQLALLYHEVVGRLHGTLIVTSDHGNAEEKITINGHPLTQHTTNPVPFLMANSRLRSTSAMCSLAQQAPVYGLCNVAPTILSLLGLSIPSDMSNEIIM